jgi:UDP-N-acetylmuramoyl-tripeptide--D-alanyl-D-alanine ligase
MAANLKRRVRLTGTANNFDFWIDGISSRWPDRLRFRIHWGDQICDIETQQVGAHWAPALTAALAAAHSLGVQMSDAARAVRQTPPYAGRMEAISLPNGAVLIRDDYNGSIDTLEASLRVLREAEVIRTVLVITDVADSGMNRHHRLKYLASAVSGWLGVLVLCGPEHEYGRRRAIEAGMSPDRVNSFATLVEVAEFLKRGLKSGDLVLLKGRTTDHVARLFFAQLGTLSCWREHCQKTMLCDTCWELGFRPDAAHADRYSPLPIFR